MTAKTTLSGKDLKARLLAAGCNIKDVAEAMDVTPQSLYAYFKSAALQRATLEKIAAAIGEEPSFFTSSKALSLTPLSGEELKAKLKKAGIPVSRVAESMRVSTQSLYAVFKSQRLRTATIEAMSKAIGKPKEWFCSYEIPASEESKDELIAALKEIIEQQRKYIASLEEKISRYEK